nr:hypothetical protein BEI47_14840 [Aliivibrio fischeri]
MIADVCVNDADLVAIIGTDLLSYDKAKFYAEYDNTPSEKAHIEDKQYGGYLPLLYLYSLLRVYW